MRLLAERRFGYCGDFLESQLYVSKKVYLCSLQSPHIVDPSVDQHGCWVSSRYQGREEYKVEVGPISAG